MHIPDGFLDLKTSVVSNLISISLLAYSIKKLNKDTDPQRIPLMGVSAAFVFVAQIISFPVFGGTSVHLSGGVIISVLLGPFSGFTIMSSVLILQAILLQHGGVLSLGANILNIAATSCFIGYMIYRIYPRNISAAVSSWISTILGALLVSAELYFSGKIDLKIGLISMILAHIVSATTEAVVTYIILLTIDKIKPNLRNIPKI
ncbi:MAG: energy-coupling factor ABC transporter permease [Candidatus Calescibacterium sp.]|nr:energy-coupling factor ABC transporter permease [Candidatus Calescibacterium sp.]MCX7733507.1 energy-coupling factor ABC transporter permease [bacterium]MDW8087220.1 energy-coupling factor ABC transporter permease [Candidatus Calescibacterium sp.]